MNLRAAQGIALDLACPIIPALELRNAPTIDVKTHNFETSAIERYRDWQTHIAQTQNRDTTAHDLTQIQSNEIPV